MWEWYTTKPFLNEVRFIGSVPTPWPSWSIAASTPTLASSKFEVRTFLESLQGFVQHFDSPEARAEENVAFIQQEFGYEKADVEAWLDTVGYESRLEGMDVEMIKTTLDALHKAGVVVKPEAGWVVEGEILASLD